MKCQTALSNCLQQWVMVFVPAGGAGVGLLWPAGLQLLPAVGRGQPHSALRRCLREDGPHSAGKVSLVRELLLFMITPHVCCIGALRQIHIVFLCSLQTSTPAQHGDPQLPADSAVHRGHDGPDLYAVPERPHNPRDPRHGRGPDQCPKQRGLPGPWSHAACSSPVTPAGHARPGAPGGCEGQTRSPILFRRVAGKSCHRAQPAQKLNQPPQGENKSYKSFLILSAPFLSKAVSMVFHYRLGEVVRTKTGCHTRMRIWRGFLVLSSSLGRILLEKHFPGMLRHLTTTLLKRISFSK